MADLKISQLPAVTMPLAETEVLPLVQSATTKKVTVAQLTTLIKHTMTMDGTNALQFGGAGFTASINYNDDGSLRIKPRAGYPVQLDLANLRFSNAGYGVDFSASPNAPGMTSELLNDYEEGTWTPAFAAWTTAPSVIFATYTKIGRQVTVTLYANDGVNAGNQDITGLPFTSSATSAGAAFGSSSAITTVIRGSVTQSSTNITNFPTNNLTGQFWQIVAIYFA